MVVGFLFWFGLWSFSEKLFLRLFKTLAYSAACCSCKQGLCHSAPKGMQVRDVHLRSKTEWPNMNLNSPPKCSDIQRFSRETHLLFVSQLFEYLCTSKYSQMLYQNVTNTRFHLSCLPCYLISFISLGGVLRANSDSQRIEKVFLQHSSSIYLLPIHTKLQGQFSVAMLV